MKAAAIRERCAAECRTSQVPERDNHDPRFAPYMNQFARPPLERRSSPRVANLIAQDRPSGNTIT